MYWFSVSYLAKSSISFHLSYPTGEFFFFFLYVSFPLRGPISFATVGDQIAIGTWSALPCTQVLPLRVVTSCFHFSSGALPVIWRCEWSALSFLSHWDLIVLGKLFKASALKVLHCGYIHIHICILYFHLYFIFPIFIHLAILSLYRRREPRLCHVN